VDIDGNNTLQIKAIGVVISTFEPLPALVRTISTGEVDAIFAPTAGTITYRDGWWWQVENGQFGREKMNTFATV
jgi:hypothetical protein